MFRCLLTLALSAPLYRGYRLAVGACNRLPCGWSRFYSRSYELSQSNDAKRAEFKGNIIVVDDSNVGSHVEPLSSLLNCKCVGFDLEYVPDYYASIYRQRGDRTRPAVVQIASVDTCIIYLVYKIGYLPECVSTLLTSDSILKVSHGAPSDMRLLHRHFGVRSRNFVDLQSVCDALKLQPCSLKSVVDHVLGLRLSKTHQCSNWEAPTLSADQLQYAATDAWVTLEAYLRLKPHKVKKLFVNESGDVQLEHCDSS